MITTIHGAPEGWDAVLLARRSAEHKGPLVHVARDDARCSAALDFGNFDTRFWNPARSAHRRHLGAVMISSFQGRRPAAPRLME